MSDLNKSKIFQIELIVSSDSKSTIIVTENGNNLGTIHNVYGVETFEDVVKSLSDEIQMNKYFIMEGENE